MLLHVGNNRVIMRENLLPQRMRIADDILYRVRVRRRDIPEIRIPLSDDGFPDEKLRRVSLRELVPAPVLAAPLRADAAGVALSHDAPNKALHLLGRHEVVEIRHIFPEILAHAGEGVARVLNHAGFDAIADVGIV